MIRPGLTLLAAALAGAALAAEAPAPGERLGRRTEALLEFQRTAKQPGASQPLRGNEAEAARRRYFESFRRPLPEAPAASPGTAAGSGK